LRIRRARSAGFCFGVRRALEHAERAVETYGPVCSLGELIHNPDVVADLNRKGITVIDDLSEARGRPVLIRSHGVAPEVFNLAREQGIVIIDTTCPFVRRVQERAEDLTRQGYQVMVIGSAEHPEVRGILGWTGYKAVVVYGRDDIELLPFFEKVGVLSQTTQTRERLALVAGDLVGRAREIRIYDTICRASLTRQEEATAIASKVSLMVVIGGRSSANTCKLAEICGQCVTTVHIENAAELDPSLLKGINSVGVTAGASTPDWIIEEVIGGMSMFDEDREPTPVSPQEAIPEVLPEAAPQDETDAATATDASPEQISAQVLTGEADAAPAIEAAPEQASAEAPSGEADAAPATVASPEQTLDETTQEPVQPEPGQEEMMNLDFAGTPRQIQQGDVIKGTVVQVRDDEVLIDIGGKSEGIIPRQELALKSVDNPHDIVKQGDIIDVFVLRVDTDEGHMTLSKKRADRAGALQQVEQALDTKEEMAGEVLKVVKGGLLVDVLGMRGFVPASLVERGYVGDLDKYVGKMLRLRVIEFDKTRGKVVLSQKSILQEEYIQAQKELWETIQPGEIRKGTVRHLTNFGAFVDLGGVDGLLHISELSWGRVKHPSEAVQEGDEVDVYVISVDRDNKRISLSLKQAQANPWKTVDERYQIGQILKGAIVRMVSFGAFVEIEPGVEGLVHISRLADFRVAKPEDVISAGQEVDVKILEINKQDQRISLSIKDAMAREEKPKRPEREREPRNDRGTTVPGDDQELSQNLGAMIGILQAQAEHQDS
jgi:ribosomal protein S1/(E)-4-hydroxy-3-methyl-but-2-enyl pyrophosphate reductase